MSRKIESFTVPCSFTFVLRHRLIAKLEQELNENNFHTFKSAIIYYCYGCRWTGWYEEWISCDVTGHRSHVTDLMRQSTRKASDNVVFNGYYIRRWFYCNQFILLYTTGKCKILILSKVYEICNESNRHALFLRRNSVKQTQPTLTFLYLLKLCKNFRPDIMSTIIFHENKQPVR